MRRKGSFPVGTSDRTFYRPIKQHVSIRVDADVLAWFRARGGGIRPISMRSQARDADTLAVR